MTITIVLCAIGILIPMYSPLKYVLVPASFTLGSHVALFLAMFISPFIAILVALGTALGFYFGKFSSVIVLRALSHVIFSFVGAIYLKKNPQTLKKIRQTAVFALLISLLHGVSEVAVVSVFYFENIMTSAFYNQGFLYTVIGLVGIGTIIHSLVDFGIALVIWKLFTFKSKQNILG
jgi:niacin transporter